MLAETNQIIKDPHLNIRTVEAGGVVSTACRTTEEAMRAVDDCALRGAPGYATNKAGEIFSFDQIRLREA